MSWPTAFGTLLLLAGLGAGLIGGISQDWFGMAYAGVIELAAIGLLILGWRE